MELLKKTIIDEDDRRRDNSNKKELFEKERHPHSADFYKDEWSCIKDTAARENIAYQMQYLEFLIFLYNDYQIYLTIESLLCKNIMAIIAGVVESSLYVLVSQEYEKADLDSEQTTDFIKLIGNAHDLGLIDREMKDDFHNLRKIRNLIHLKGIEYQEHDAYAIDETNKYLETLNRFKEKVTNYYNSK